MAALRPAHRPDVGVHHRRHHLQPARRPSRSRPSCTSPPAGHRDRHCLRQHRRSSRSRVALDPLTAVPVSGRPGGAQHLPQGRSQRGTATSTSTRPGTPPTELVRVAALTGMRPRTCGGSPGRHQAPVQRSVGVLGLAVTAAESAPGAARDVVYGGWVSIPHPLSARALRRAGLDLRGHRPAARRPVESDLPVLTAAIRLAGARDRRIRVRSHRRHRPLARLGCEGVIVPNVESAELAARAGPARAATPPEGHRSAGGVLPSKFRLLRDGRVHHRGRRVAGDPGDSPASTDYVGPATCLCRSAAPSIRITRCSGLSWRRSGRVRGAASRRACTRWTRDGPALPGERLPDGHGHRGYPDLNRGVAGGAAAAAREYRHDAAAVAAVDRYFEELFIRPIPCWTPRWPQRPRPGCPRSAVSPTQASCCTCWRSACRRAGSRDRHPRRLQRDLARRALPEGGRLLTLERIRPCRGRAGESRQGRTRADREVRLGPGAGQPCAAWRTPGGAFDLIFIDADKTGYPAYSAGSLRLSGPGTVIVADNVVRGGGVADASSEDARSGVSGSTCGWQRRSPGLPPRRSKTWAAKSYDGFSLKRVRADP